MYCRILLYFLLPLSAVASPVIDSSYDDLWKAFKVKHMKDYNVAEEDMRRVVWERNAKLISRHNLEADMGIHSYRLELNKFSDKIASELDVYRKCFSPKETSNIKVEIFNSTCGKSCYFSLPPNVDWRTQGYVTEVKDQADCGSCWAFSSTGALEGQTKAKKGFLVSLSEQNLVDCSWKQGNNGCNGGWMDYAFQYVIENQGLDTEQVYPYQAKDRRCRFKRSGVGANCTSYVKINPGSETDLQAAVATVGPVSVAIDASSDKFMSYSGGIYYDNSCTSKELDHAVLVVGYGSKDGRDYWIVKNSWGKSWGLDGYILMARNAGNQCGIASHAVYPVV